MRHLHELLAQVGKVECALAHTLGNARGLLGIDRGRGLLHQRDDVVYFFSGISRHTRSTRDWSTDVCSSDLRPRRQRGHPRAGRGAAGAPPPARRGRGGRHQRGPQGGVDRPGPGRDRGAPPGRPGRRARRGGGGPGADVRQGCATRAQPGPLRRAPGRRRPGHGDRAWGQAVTAVSALTEPAADAAIGAACQLLHLPTVRAQAHELADAAARDRLSHRAYLAELLSAETDARDARRRDRRVKEARFPRVKRLDAFDLTAAPEVAPATLATLAAGTWIDHGQPLVLLGDSGTGKTHLLIGAGIAACEQGRAVRYTTCAALVNELVEAADERTLAKTIARRTSGW